MVVFLVITIHGVNLHLLIVLLSLDLNLLLDDVLVSLGSISFGLDHSILFESALLFHPNTCVLVDKVHVLIIDLVVLGFSLFLIFFVNSTVGHLFLELLLGLLIIDNELFHLKAKSCKFSTFIESNLRLILLLNLHLSHLRHQSHRLSHHVSDGIFSTKDISNYFSKANERARRKW